MAKTGTNGTNGGYMQTHTIIIYHCDGECSNEGTYLTRTDALYHAERIADYLTPNESVSVDGFTIRGRHPVERD